MAQRTVFCEKCLKPIGEMPIKIGFRDRCLHCGSELHSCKNCRFYSPGKPNDCMVLGTDPIRDRETANFCEEFQIQLPSDSKGSLNQAKRIFGNDLPKKKDFNSLFKDEE